MAQLELMVALVVMGRPTLPDIFIKVRLAVEISVAKPFYILPTVHLTICRSIISVHGAVLPALTWT